jgi:hypothetical protein
MDTAVCVNELLAAKAPASAVPGWWREHKRPEEQRRGLEAQVLGVLFVVAWGDCRYLNNNRSVP